MKTVSINNEQNLYVISCDGVYSCAGFDNYHNETLAIAKELGRSDLEPNEKGTLDAYALYEKAIQAAKESGKRLQCGLTKQLLGLEGRRVEVITTYGEKRRFNVGKSTGFIPCHLEVHNSRSRGGVSAEKEYTSVRVIR